VAAAIPIPQVFDERYIPNHYCCVGAEGVVICLGRATRIGALGASAASSGSAHNTDQGESLAVNTY